jgi:hypothetical protein
MWEVIATSKSGKVRTKVVNHWKHGMRLAGRAMDMGWRVTIVPVYVDLLIADEEGEFTRVIARVSPHNAARNAVRWARIDRESGCLIWPHGLPTPRDWRVVEKSNR